MMTLATLALVGALIKPPSGVVLRPTAPTADPAACTKQGGVIRKVCLSQSLACVVPYRDAGKACTDNAQCKGGCIYQSTGKPLPAGGKVVGTCKRTNDPCGCFAEVVKGKVTPGFCRD